MKINDEIFYIIVLYKAFKTWCAFYICSTSEFGLVAPFQVVPWTQIAGVTVLASTGLHAKLKPRKCK